MASALGLLLKAQLEVSVKGADSAKSTLRGLREEVSRLGSTSGGSAGFAAQAKALQQLRNQAQGVGNAFALTRQEALTLNFTIGDIVASLASGASPLTVLLQQGGQVRDGFGSISNLLNKIAAQFVRFAPQIAAVGAAIAGISFVKLGESAAAAAEEIGNLTAKAGVSLETFQDFEAAGAAKGLTGDAIAQGLNTIGAAALKSAEAAQEFQDKWSKARQTGSQIVTDSKLIAEGLQRSGASANVTGDIFSDLGFDLRRYSGSVEDQTKLLYDLADAIAALSNSGGRRSAQILQNFRNQFGGETLRVFKLGAAGIRAAGIEVEKFGPKLSESAEKQGRSFQELTRIIELGGKRLKEALGVIFLPAAQASQDFFATLAEGRAKKLEEFRGALEVTGRALTEFFRIVSGKQATFSTPFLAGVVEGVTIVKKAVTSAADAIPALFDSIKDSAEKGLVALDNALSNAGGTIGEVYNKIKDASGSSIETLKAVFKDFKVDAGVVGAIIGIVGALKLLQTTVGLVTPVLFAFGSAIARLAIVTALSPLNLVINAILGVGRAAQSVLGLVASLALRLAELAVGGVAGTLQAITGGISGLGGLALAAAKGIAELGKALAGLTLRVLFSPAVLGLATIVAGAAAVSVLAVNWDRVGLAAQVAGQSVKTNFLLPLEASVLRAGALLDTLLGKFEDLQNSAAGVFGGKVLDAAEQQLKFVLTAIADLVNELVGKPIKALGQIIVIALNAVWSGAGDGVKKVLDRIDTDSKAVGEQINQNFINAAKKRDAALGIDKTIEAEKKKLGELQTALGEALKPKGGSLLEDQTARASDRYRELIDVINNATGAALDPNNLGKSTLNAVGRLYDSLNAKIDQNVAKTKQAGATAEETAKKVQTIGVIRGGVRSEVPILTNEVNELGKAVDGVSRKTVSIRVGRGGQLGSTTVEVEQIGASAERSTEKVGRLGNAIDQIEVPQGYSVDAIEKPLDAAIQKTQRFNEEQRKAASAPPAVPVDTVSIDQANSKLRELERLQQSVKTNATVPAAPVTAADPQNPQTSPIENARLAVQSLGQLIQNTLQEASNFAGAAVTLVANGVVAITDPALQSINSLNDALTRAIQSVNQLANSLASLPSLKDYSGSNTGQAGMASSGGFAGGGFVLGPGTSTSDSIPAWLSTGEFVVRAAAVQKYGLDLFRRLNGMTVNTPKTFSPRFAMGGLVSPSSLSSAQSSGRPLVLQIDGKSFGGLSGPPGVVNALEKHVTQRRLSSTTKTAPSWVR